MKNYPQAKLVIQSERKHRTACFKPANNPSVVSELKSNFTYEMLEECEERKKIQASTWVNE